jgi:hypothetical protein
MLVFSYAIEIDASDPKADGYNDLLREAAGAYRKRAACSRARAEAEAAARDQKRAEEFEAKARTATAATVAARLSGRVTLINNWNASVTVVLADVSYTLQSGETKEVATPPGTFSYEVQTGPHRVTGKMDAGQRYTIGPPRSAP